MVLHEHGRRAVCRAVGCGVGPVLLDEFLRDGMQIQLEGRARVRSGRRERGEVRLR